MVVTHRLLAEHRTVSVRRPKTIDDCGMCAHSCCRERITDVLTCYCAVVVICGAVHAGIYHLRYRCSLRRVSDADAVINDWNNGVCCWSSAAVHRSHASHTHWSVGLHFHA